MPQGGAKKTERRERGEEMMGPARSDAAETNRGGKGRSRKRAVTGVRKARKAAGAKGGPREPGGGRAMTTRKTTGTRKGAGTRKSEAAPRKVKAGGARKTAVRTAVGGRTPGRGTAATRQATTRTTAVRKTSRAARTPTAQAGAAMREETQGLDKELTAGGQPAAQESLAEPLTTDRDQER